MVAETKAVLALLEPDPVLTPSQLTLAAALAERTLAPLAAMLDLMLPPGLGQQADTVYQLAITPVQLPQAQQAAAPLARRLLGLLAKHGARRGRQLDQALPRLDWRKTMRSLVHQGLVVTQTVLPTPTVQAKVVRTVQLAVPPAEAEAAMPSLGRAGSGALARRQAMLRLLLHEAGPLEVAWAYAESGGNLSDLHALAERGLVTLGAAQVWRDPLAEMDYLSAEPPTLTHDQQAAWEVVLAAVQAAAAGQPGQPMLLHGVTGSGKTEIYLRAAAETIRLGRQALLLVPEIALTPQAVRRVLARFPGQVGLVHSRLSPGERYDTWRRARLGQLPLIVGPRSALFTPLPDVGLIVLDECHDASYYQAEPPCYDARQAALLYSDLSHAACLFGSATPEVVQRYQAEPPPGGPGQFRYLSLPARILAHQAAVHSQLERLAAAGRAPAAAHYHPLEGQAEMAELPPVQLVDMRQELKEGHTSIFSRPLLAGLEQVLAQGQQAILFLNRRGAATYVFCRDCGHTLKCPRCDLPLTLHSAESAPAELLRCHYCNYQRQLPHQCPNCRSQRIRQYGTGTEKVEKELQALFPKARTLRWDYDTTRQKGAHEVILGHFSSQRADVLIGTQMLAKGLDLPLVTLVGAVLADVGLSLPDYRAAERTFQVLTQVAGRAGRSPLGGQVVMQTFQPEHYAIQAASRHDYAAFYQQELAYRRQLGYPPFTRLVRLEYRHRDPAQAEAAAQALAARLIEWLAAAGRRATELVGPTPCFFANLGGQARWQIVLRGPDPAAALSGKNLPGWRVEVDPISLL
jgi:primosomal protein N' (replication factor Y)